MMDKIRIADYEFEKKPMNIIVDSYVIEQITIESQRDDSR